VARLHRTVRSSSSHENLRVSHRASFWFRRTRISMRSMWAMVQSGLAPGFSLQKPVPWCRPLGRELDHNAEVPHATRRTQDENKSRFTKGVGDSRCPNWPFSRQGGHCFLRKVEFPRPPKCSAGSKGSFFWKLTYSRFARLFGMVTQPPVVFSGVSLTWLLKITPPWNCSWKQPAKGINQTRN
jgi:hypothetical protein